MKIALIDDPSCCYHCPLYGTLNHYCWYSGKHVEETDETKEVAEWCELIDLPKEKEYDENNEHPINDGYVAGWNHCLRTIRGDE